ncbi:hypothetical protein MMA231_03514 (plasmid) [Asticcacaulis sp. MM231]|uniref:type II toxin-antitoxin system HipA family toxin n=1 Tax=Asticcacaulis sp. MM231 TaxID=3157666 RepID=UPI0032D57D62
MKYKPVSRLKVTLDIEGASRCLGEMAWSHQERCAFFEFDGGYLNDPYTVSPFYLPAKSGAQPAKREPFEGLHGIFNDSLPDGWGRLLLDRRLQKHGIDHHALTPIDRLAAVGATGMGALSYQPELPSPKGLDPSTDMDWFAEEISRIQEELSITEIETLQGAQGGSAGARPKIMVGLSKDRKHIVIDYGQPLPAGYEPWLVKFRSSNDPQEIGAEEEAYARIARAAGVDMAETRLIETAKGKRLFATRRFDRNENGRLHMHTVSGLVHADHRTPSLDYKDVLKVVHMMTRDHQEVLRMYRRMVFNVLAHNRDDHAKNHALLMNWEGIWKLSPAYDLTLSSGPGGEHCTTIANEGRNPGQKHMLEIARITSITEREASAEIDRSLGGHCKLAVNCYRSGSAERTNS